ncbi:MAG TPA: hypothetical protein PL151_07355 [Phycisphaerae bacterium]|nr:hypothetical protein [Phycisphaerae bacterium]HOJ73907.1 hypothetical protein [Phycisphaerae bacterium]HOM50848.1 hypothetical protein [Phycisphaerae bacterium]HON66863.1 hypothetical protein [Phycisphaerae bacterium]HOQ88405.1 hypothetical protein [Phycisphaerae bacterium]
MTRLFNYCKWLSMAGVLFSGSCLADNFWSTLLGDTVIAGATAIVVDAVVTGFLPQ